MPGNGSIDEMDSDKSGQILLIFVKLDCPLTLFSPELINVNKIPTNRMS